MPVALLPQPRTIFNPQLADLPRVFPVPLPLSFFSFIFNCVFNLRRATRLSDIRAYKNIAERHRRFTTNSQRHFPIKFSAGFLVLFFLCFCFLISFGICALVSPLCIDFWAHQPHYINRKYRSWVPIYDEHIGKLNQTVNRLVVLLVMMVPPFANPPPCYPFWLFFLGCHKMSIICRLFALSSRYVCTVSPLPSTCLMSMGNKQWESGEKMPSHLVSVLPINSCLSSRINISILFCFRLIDVVLEYYRQMCSEIIEHDIIIP